MSTPPAQPSTSQGPRTWACGHCDVLWRSFDAECWMCGRVSTGRFPLAVAARDAATHTDPVAVSATVALSRWGTNVYEAQANGLPDPRPTRLPDGSAPRLAG